METGNNKNLNGFITKNGSRDYDYLRSIGDYNMPVHKEVETILSCGYTQMVYDKETKIYSFEKLDAAGLIQHYDYKRKAVFDYAKHLFQIGRVSFNAELADAESETNIYQALQAIKKKRTQKSTKNNVPKDGVNIHISKEDADFLFSLFNPIFGI